MSTQEQKQSYMGVIITIVIVLVSVGIYFFYQKDANETVTASLPEITVPETLEEDENILEETLVEAPVIDEVEAIETPEELDIEKVVPEEVLPLLEESDQWFTDKFVDLTWRKELLELIITKDIIRRFVVFSDNFSRGVLAYEHSPVIKPNIKFSAIERKSAQGVFWLWDEKNSQRFKLYIDLLRTVDKELLINWYVELKPLIYQAYEELGYEGEEFEDVLQICISKVLDMEIPKNLPELERPSVMYKYTDSDLESLDEAEKLMLRLGKENLLILKSVMLEINEKLVRIR